MPTTKRCPVPTQFGARIAVATQNILREEAHLTDVIDPLGGSYYVEALTNEMEEKVLAIMAEVEAAVIDVVGQRFNLVRPAQRSAIARR